MQWILTRPVNASDFFHGPLELLEPGVNCLLLKDEGELRPLIERVDAFVQGHTDRVMTIDTAEMGSLDLPGELRGLMAPALLATMLERVSAHLEVLRDHPLTTRRYYRAMSY
jgi:fructoselysine-6-phosphate deglycase